MILEFDESQYNHPNVPSHTVISRPSCVSDCGIAQAEHMNGVELLEWWGSDLAIAGAAWTSTSIDAETEAAADPARVPNLLRFLIENEHGTPFEQAGVRFRVLVDNPTHIQLLRHRTMSPNVESARYRPYAEAKCYVPPEANAQLKAVRVADFERTFNAYLGRVEHLTSHLKTQGYSAKEAKQRAKEIARYDLPQCLQVYMVVSFNLRAFQNFLYLRHHSHAQREIRELAEVMYEVVVESGAFPYAVPLLMAHAKAKQEFTKKLSLKPALKRIQNPPIQEVSK